MSNEMCIKEKYEFLRMYVFLFFFNSEDSIRYIEDFELSD